ncbi:hypothetical protein Tco_0169467 [Tanacetum coccineum]
MTSGDHLYLQPLSYPQADKGNKEGSKSTKATQKDRQKAGGPLETIPKGNKAITKERHNHTQRGERITQQRWFPLVAPVPAAAVAARVPGSDSEKGGESPLTGGCVPNRCGDVGFWCKTIWMEGALDFEVNRWERLFISEYYSKQTANWKEKQFAVFLDPFELFNV